MNSFSGGWVESVVPFLNHFIDVIQHYIWKLEFSFANWWWHHYAVKLSSQSPLNYFYEISSVHCTLMHPSFKAIKANFLLFSLQPTSYNPLIYDGVYTHWTYEWKYLQLLYFLLTLMLQCVLEMHTGCQPGWPWESCAWMWSDASVRVIFHVHGLLSCVSGLSRLLRITHLFGS